MLELIGAARQFLYGGRLFGTVDLCASDGEKIAVLGGAGSGKTSLLKMLAGIEESEGGVLLDGKPVSVKSDDIIMVFDDGAVFPFKTVYDNLAYPLSIRKMNKADISLRVRAAAGRMGITACLNQRARALTPVEKRRMAAARILVREARLILVDDITKGLPKEDADALWSDLSRVLYERAAEGAVVIYATSQKSEALSTGDRIMVLHGGDVKQIGTAQEIWERPASIWAAEAVDERYNFEKCTLSVENETLTLIFENNDVLDLTSIKDRITEHYIGKSVFCGWHPEAPSAYGKAEKIVFAEGGIEGFLLETESGRKAKSQDKLAEISALPSIESIILFDAVSENSIML